jgi:glycosyltransferase involved in cell wall biosynthesis
VDVGGDGGCDDGGAEGDRAVSERTPLVSIVTPSFNYARYLGACLESVRSQTHGNLEHLVLDACSTDGTGAVLKAFEGTYPLRVHVEKDRGQANALNEGFARAKGDVLCWLNADDYYLGPRVLERAIAVLAERPDVDVVTGGGVYVDAEGRPGKPIPTLPVAELRYHDTFLQPATFWRRRVHRELREDLHFTFDWRFFLGMVRDGARVLAVDESWAAYRMHEVNKTAADPAARRREIADVLGEEWGRFSPQHLWARTMYRGYALSEATGVGAIKSCFAVSNTVLKALTRRRIYSG